MGFNEEELEDGGQFFECILLFYKDNYYILDGFEWCWNLVLASPTGIEPVFYA